MAAGVHREERGEGTFWGVAVGVSHDLIGSIGEEHGEGHAKSIRKDGCG